MLSDVDVQRKGGNCENLIQFDLICSQCETYVNAERNRLEIA